MNGRFIGIGLKKAMSVDLYDVYCVFFILIWLYFSWFDLEKSYSLHEFA